MIIVSNCQVLEPSATKLNTKQSYNLYNKKSKYPTLFQEIQPLPGFHQAFTKFGKMFNSFLNQHIEDMDMMEHSSPMNNQMCLYNEKK